MGRVVPQEALMGNSHIFHFHAQLPNTVVSPNPPNHLYQALQLPKVLPQILDHFSPSPGVGAAVGAMAILMVGTHEMIQEKSTRPLPFLQ